MEYLLFSRFSYVFSVKCFAENQPRWNVSQTAYIINSIAVQCFQFIKFHNVFSQLTIFLLCHDLTISTSLEYMLNVQYFKGKDFTCKIFYANQHPLVEKKDYQNWERKMLCIQTNHSKTPCKHIWQVIDGELWATQTLDDWLSICLKIWCDLFAYIALLFEISSSQIMVFVFILKV